MASSMLVDMDHCEFSLIFLHANVQRWDADDAVLAKLAADIYEKNRAVGIAHSPNLFG